LIGQDVEVARIAEQIVVFDVDFAAGLRDLDIGTVGIGVNVDVPIDVDHAGDGRNIAIVQSLQSE